MNTSAIYTICTKFDITGETFETMLNIWNGADFFSFTDAERALFNQMYNDLEQYEALMNPRPVVVKARRTRKAA